jgi:hypothetical protein
VVQESSSPQSRSHERGGQKKFTMEDRENMEIKQDCGSGNSGRAAGGQSGVDILVCSLTR